MTTLEWVAVVCAVIILGPPAAHLIHGALTGKKPSAAEAARAEQIAATPAHPSVRHPGLPADGRPLDSYEQERLDAVVRDSWDALPEVHVPQQRGRP